MNKRNLTSAVALSFSLLAMAGTAYGLEIVTPPGDAQVILPPGKLTARYAVVPYRGSQTVDQITQDSETRVVASVHYWSKSIAVAGTTYKYMMVGKSPFLKQAIPVTNVKTVIVPIRFKFYQGLIGSTLLHTSDPTVADATCSPHGTPLNQVLNSPVFKNITNYKPNGINVGTGQFVSLFQRASFWKYTKPTGINPGYQVTLAPVVTHATLEVPVTNSNVQAVTCGKLALISIGGWDQLVQSQIMPLLAGQGYGPNVLPLFLFYNVVMYDTTPSNCCILGYHGAMSNPNFGGAFQAYANVDYDTTKAFTGTGDISVLTHEIAEWMDDPNGNNPTPPWGHIGQVSGCQNNLEVGDPLSGTIKPVALGGFTYHVQDQAFFSWFYRQVPSIGTNGKYSLYGTFTTKAAPCP